ncbi:hypothetical protein D3C84_1280960 [compost metagenome]
MGGEQVIQAGIVHRRGGQMHPQLFDTQLLPAGFSQAAQTQAQCRTGLDHAGQGLRFIAAEQQGFGDFHRP